MTKHEQALLLQDFVAGLKASDYTDYEVRQIRPNLDSDIHSADWDGRFLLLEGTLTLEIAGTVRDIVAGEAYEVPADTAHREVFGAEGANLCIARRRVGDRPLREIAAAIPLTG